ncbi:MAG: DUF4920 domain-containing protein [Pyrinomonadaceae bacterium]
MKRITLVLSFVLALGISAFAQEMNSKGDPIAKNEQNKPVELNTGDKITRGGALAKNVKKASVERAFKDPAKIADKTVELNGVVVRSCKMEGCWAEVADKQGGKSVRVTFGDHAFFIPLNAAGLRVRAQGTFKTKTLSKDHVDHMIKDDGARFDNRNADGSVTEVSFDATGVELVKAG